MSFEGNNQPETELEAALARLKRHMDEHPNTTQELSTPNGFSGVIKTYACGHRNLSLQKGGETSMFEITDDGNAIFMELRDVDGKLLNLTDVALRHQTEADHSVNNNELDLVAKEEFVAQRLKDAQAAEDLHLHGEEHVRNDTEPKE